MRAVVLALLTVSAGAVPVNLHPDRSIAFEQAPDSAPKQPHHEAVLLQKVRRLAERAIAQKVVLPEHEEHARSMMLLSSFEALHASELHAQRNLEVIVNASDTMTTTELEAEHLWLTQYEIDLLENQRDASGALITHEPDRIQERRSTNAAKALVNATSSQLELVQLQYSDIDVVATNWAESMATHGVIRWCFQSDDLNTFGPFEETTKSTMRQAFVQAQSEINALGSCLVFQEVPTCNNHVKMIVVGRWDSSCWFNAYNPITGWSGASWINLGWCKNHIHKWAVCWPLSIPQLRGACQRRRVQPSAHTSRAILPQSESSQDQDSRLHLADDPRTWTRRWNGSREQAPRPRCVPHC